MLCKFGRFRNVICLYWYGKHNALLYFLHVWQQHIRVIERVWWKVVMKQCKSFWCSQTKDHNEPEFGTRMYMDWILRQKTLNECNFFKRLGRPGNLHISCKHSMFVDDRTRLQTSLSGKDRDLPVPLVWSLVGPVSCDPVGPWDLVQLKSSVMDWVHIHVPDSKLQSYWVGAATKRNTRYLSFTYSVAFNLQ